MYFTAPHQASTPFPTLDFNAQDQWEWPVPPFAWPHLPPPNNGVAQACSVETVAGTTVRGEMLEFDPVARRLGVRSGARAPTVSLAFSGVLRLTLTVPMRAAPQIPGAPLERVPAAAQERDYTLHAATPGRAPLTGRTAGHVETDAGMYLFTPVDEEAALQRVFVPRSAYSRCEFGSTALEAAARLWCAGPAELLAAIERQQRMPVRPIGQSLRALGLVTQDQLDRALARADGGLRLGEALVAARVITPADLETAIAHKMGYPLVDLTRFPVEPAAAARLSRLTAERHRVVPLMLDRERLIVAVESPSRVMALRSLQVHAQAAIVPVLAPALQITIALRSSDMWTGLVKDRPGAGRTRP